MVKKETQKNKKDESVWEWKDLNHFSDFMKRVPAAFASGKDFRIWNEDDGTVAVRPHYTSATVRNIDNVGSSYFTDKDGKWDEKNLSIVAKATNSTVSELKKLFKPYTEVNVTDAQAWITMEVYRERMRGLGKWTPAHQDAYDKSKRGETLQYNDLALLAQPLKTVHAEMMETAKGVMSMQYNKQSEAVLIPSLTKGTKLDQLRIAMEAEGGPDHVIVLDGKKAGAMGLTEISDGKGNMLDAGQMSFNPVKLSYTGLFLQQDLNAKGIKPTLVGSQGVKNVMSVIDPNGTYFNDQMTAMELVSEYNRAISSLSNMGIKGLHKKIGYSNGILNKKQYHALLQSEFLGEVSDNFLEAFNGITDLDSFPIKDKIQNKGNAMITQSAIKLKQLGGAFIQMSDFGIIGAEVNLDKSIKDGIVWFKDPA